MVMDLEEGTCKIGATTLLQPLPLKYIKQPDYPVLKGLKKKQKTFWHLLFKLIYTLKTNE